MPAQYVTVFEQSASRMTGIDHDALSSGEWLAISEIQHNAERAWCISNPPKKSERTNPARREQILAELGF